MRAFAAVRARNYVTSSPWPISLALATAAFLASFVTFEFSLNGSFVVLLGSLLLLVSVLFFWFRDMSRESDLEGNHGVFFISEVKGGMILFIVSEIMLFFAFFWAYFSNRMDPDVSIGASWPPYGIEVIIPTAAPLLNTFILLSSGFFVTVAHNFFVSRKFGFSVAMLVCLWFAFGFLAIQFSEYVGASFGISDGIYGTTFYMLTGLHGVHVLVGSVILVVGFLRALTGRMSTTHHVSLECGIWYWHFVDVVWLFLVFFVYFDFIDVLATVLEYADIIVFHILKPNVLG